MSGPDPAVAAVRVAVRRVLRALPEGSLVLAAVSGGADSLALAAALAFLAPRLGLRAGAVIVDHGLQPGSDAVADTAARACRELGLAPAAVVPVQVAATGEGPEAAARDARYAALHGAAGRWGATAVLLGHTRDDQAESVLLGLARGSGTRSLAGMAARRGLLHRPLLHLSRSTTSQACAALGLLPWQDPHNGDSQFARARVRAVMPHLTQALGPGFVPALARSADLARDDADALDAIAGEAFREIGGAAVRALSVPGRPPGLPVLDLLALLPALRRRVLHRAAAAAGSPPGRLVSAHVMAMDALLTAWHGQGPVALPGRVRVVRRCGRLLFVDDKDMGDDLAKVLISREQIATRLAEIATQIDADYAGRDLLLVGVLKGAVMVMADLARAVSHPAEMDWMAVSSYGSGTKSSGVVRILKDLDQDITGRNVLIVEDVIDSGLTLSWLLSNLRSRGPESVEVCALLRKPSTAKVAIDVRYVGFDIEPDFVVGYGLDYQQRYRNLPFVGLLSPTVYS